MEFTHHPARALAVPLKFSHIAVAAAQVHQPLDPFGQGAGADVLAVHRCLGGCLPAQQLGHGLGGQAGSQGIEQAEGEMLAAIGEAATALPGQAPAIAGPARPFGAGAGQHQAVLFKGAQVTAHHLDRHHQLGGEVCGRGLALTKQQGQHRFPGGGAAGANRCPQSHSRGIGLTRLVIPKKGGTLASGTLLGRRWRCGLGGQCHGPRRGRSLYNHLATFVLRLWSGPGHPSPLRLGWDGRCLAQGRLGRVGERRGWLGAGHNWPSATGAGFGALGLTVRKPLGFVIHAMRLFGPLGPGLAPVLARLRRSLAAHVRHHNLRRGDQGQ